MFLFVWFQFLSDARQTVGAKRIKVSVDAGHAKICAPPSECITNSLYLHCTVCFFPRHIPARAAYIAGCILLRFAGHQVKAG